MKPYDANKENPAQAFRDGVQHTGDLTEREERGLLTYVGRADDVFPSSYCKLHAFELKSALIKHHAAPKALVISTPGHEPSSALEECFLGCRREHLALHDQLHRLNFTESPKPISGRMRCAGFPVM